MDNRSSVDRTAPLSDDESELKMEEIRADIAGTRASLADRLDALQEKAMGTVEAAQATVEQTVTSVQQTMESAKRTFDLCYQTEQRPWLMVGIATAAGAVAGHFIGGSRGQTVENTAIRHITSPVGNGVAPPAAKMYHETSPGLFTEEWNKLKGLVIGAGMAMVRDWLKETAPNLRQQIDDLMEGATHKLGGVEVKGPMFTSAGDGRAYPQPDFRTSS